MEIDRVEAEKVRRARMTIRKIKVKKVKVKTPMVKDAKNKGQKGRVDQKGKEGDHKGKGEGEDQKGKGVATCYTCGKPGHLAKDCWRNHIRQVASDQTHSSSGEASVTTHTGGQQHANVSQRRSSEETRPVVRRIENSEPTSIDLREKEDELEDSE